MKHYAHKILAFVAMTMLLLPGWSSAQEMIKKIDDYSYFSMARSHRIFKNWVVYDEKVDASIFGLMDTACLNNYFVQTKKHIHVRDMMVVSDTLFFCGYMYGDEVQHDVGVMGFFTIPKITVPSTMTITCVLFEEFRELRKLDYYVMYSTKHLVMVGTGYDDLDYVADAYYCFNPSGPMGGGYWNKAWARMPNIDAVFDDIVVSGRNVVVSARVENETEVQLCFIEKSMVYNFPFFTGSPFRMSKLSPIPWPGERVHLQPQKDSVVYAVYRSDPYMELFKYSGSQYIASLQIPVLHIVGYFPESFTVKDVCIDNALGEFSVLITKEYSDVPYHRIYHIPVTLFPAGGTVYAHEYSTGSYIPVSLCGGTNLETVSMGKMLDIWTIARVKNPLFYGCTTQYEIKAGNKGYGYEPQNKEYVSWGDLAKVTEVMVEPLKLDIYHVCGLKEGNNNPTE